MCRPASLGGFTTTTPTPRSWPPPWKHGVANWKASSAEIPQTRQSHSDGNLLFNSEKNIFQSYLSQALSKAFINLGDGIGADRLQVEHGDTDVGGRGRLAGIGVGQTTAAVVLQLQLGFVAVAVKNQFSKQLVLQQNPPGGGAVELLPGIVAERVEEEAGPIVG
jgi:hypothetical protein